MKTIIIYGQSQFYSILTENLSQIGFKIINITDKEEIKKRGVSTPSFEYNNNIYTDIRKLIQVIDLELKK